MSAKGKTVVIFGGSGAIGTATARVLAQGGAKVRLGARRLERVEVLAKSIRKAGGDAEAFQVDVLDETAMATQMSELSDAWGGMDVAVNATSFMHNQGKEISELTLQEFLQGSTPFVTALFNIAKTASPHMGGARSGAIITVAAPAARLAVPGHLGHIVGCAGVEALTRALASELGKAKIRVVCVRSHAISDALEAGSYTCQLFAAKAQALGMTVQEWVGGAAGSTMLQRLPTLSQVEETLAFLASDNAGAMTATTINLTSGLTLG
jgi:NAD(P)-dependent dehydrogenase (short-subunit alcohol dehydrogenase family)